MGGVKVAGSCCFHLQQPMLPYPPSSSSPQTLASIFSSSSPSMSMSMRRATNACCTFHISHLSSLLGSTSTKLSRIPSLDDFRGRRRISKRHLRTRASSDSLDGFFADDDEFIRQLEDDNNDNNNTKSTEIRNQEAETTTSRSQDAPHFSSVPSAESPWPAIHPNWLDRDEIVPASIEMKANSVDLPLSLRIIKQKQKKKRWEQGFREAGESACCSVNKAFSSMVFIVRELQSYALQMREILFYENLQGILARVQGEMNASFVWLFQQIFSCTPTLMVYVMLLLANFTVYSIGHSSAIAAAVSPTMTTQSIVAMEQDCLLKLEQNQRIFDASSIRSFSVGRTASVGGSGSGGGKVKPVAGDTDDGGGSDGSSAYYGSTVIQDGMSMASASEVTQGGGDTSEAVVVTEEEEVVVWDRIMEEASRMQASSRDEVLMDPDTLQHLVSPVTVELEPEDDYYEYLQTELMYHQALSQDPNNVLLLSNFAQFLYLVLHAHDRAEYYFKLAVGMKPADAEALNRYANFLWLARNDLGAAEESYLEAIAADPSSTYHAANYAHFLWHTGGEDTCYPLDGTDAY